ncbi:hypothetical protein [Rhizobium sp. A37_96]
MGTLLAFAPFIAFALVDRLIGATEGLIVGAIVSAALLLRDWVAPGRSPKILEIGTTILFGALALYAVFGGPNWSIVGVRLCVDLGLLLIVLISMALRRPFTLQYAREQVSAELWSSPQFMRTNYVITAAWALAFFVLVTADIVLLYVPALPPRIGIISTIVALIAAVKFTAWYPERRSLAEPTSESRPATPER